MAGISETWTADHGIWYDEDEKIWLIIYEGLPETETNKGNVRVIIHIPHPVIGIH